MTVKFNESSNECLAKYAEQISDDFQSTFTIVSDNTLANMLGMPGDFESLTKIIHKYLPSVKVEFINTKRLSGSCNIFLIKTHIVGKCNICNSPTKGRRETCSPICLKESRARSGRIAADKNRPTGPKHFLWKGGAENRRARIKAHKLMYPERHKANQRVHDATRRGKLLKQPCVVCGETKSEAHHEDYNKPMEIIWLCRKHHREADKKLGIGSADFKPK